MLITVTSQKGGVGKTTTAVSLAYAIAEYTAERTLLVDLDPQGHCAISLGMDPQPGIYNWLTGRVLAEHGSHRMRDNGLRLLPGDSHTKLIPLDRINPRRFAELSEFADVVIVDTPAYGLLQEAAIEAAAHIVIPVRCELLGLDGVHATLALARRLNPAAKTHILPTGVDLRLREHNAILTELREQYPAEIVARIPARVAVAEACAHGLTVYEFEAPGLPAVCHAYTGLAERITREIM